MNNDLIGRVEAAADSLRAIGRREEATAVVELMRSWRRLAVMLAEKSKAAEPVKPQPASAANPLDELFKGFSK